MKYFRLALLSLLTLKAQAQTAANPWNARLVGHPLYLRSCVIDDQLEFDGAGKLEGTGRQAPFTMCGVDVQQVALKGKSLVIEGVRVALVAGAEQGSGLERRQIWSTTHIAFSLRSRDKRDFHAPEVLKITIHPDPAGSFDKALAGIFADGLAELAPLVPLYWQCYARSYFQPGEVVKSAEKDVERCVVTPATPLAAGSISDADGETLAPVMISSTQVRLPERALEVGARGTALVHLRVGVDGVPIGLQVIRAVGCGVDEAVLEAVSQDRFKPATRAGVAVPVDETLDFRLDSPASR